MKARILVTIGAALLAAVATAGERFAYQGVLQDAAGAAMGTDKKPSVTFKLYAEATGGTALWGRKATVTTDATGLFNIELSDSLEKVGELNGTLDDAFAATLKKGKDLYLGLTVDTGTEIAPRQKILSVPLASVAKTVRKASGSFAVGGAVAFGGAATFKGATAFGGGATLSGDTAFLGTTTFEKDISVQKDALGTMPVGAIVMWWGDEKSIPRGWHLCNGEKVGHFQTPDLRNRIPIGASQTYPRGQALGEAKVKLTVDSMPSHSHEFVHDLKGPSVPGFPRDDRCYTDKKKGFAFANTLSVYNTIDIYDGSSGGDQPHENMPPYTAIYFIIRVQ